MKLSGTKISIEPLTQNFSSKIDSEKKPVLEVVEVRHGNLECLYQPGTLGFFAIH